jgi:group I intron endonuclease
MRIRLSPLAMTRNTLNNTLNKLHFKGSIISHIGFKVGFHNNSSSSLIVYEDVLINKKQILQDNKQKCGIHKWINKINGKSYVGSSVNLSSRLSSYLSKNYLTKRASIYNSKIYNALLAYGYNSFRLEILEYCDRSNVIKVEQDYIDKLKPEYNILTKAGSSLNFKHSKETLDKFKSRTLSLEALASLKKAKIGATLSPLAKANQLLATSHIITVRDIETNITKEYSSIRSAARELQVSHPTLLYYVDKNKVYKDKYIIERKKT